MTSVLLFSLFPWMEPSYAAHSAVIAARSTSAYIYYIVSQVNKRLLLDGTSRSFFLSFSRSTSCSNALG